MCVRWFFEIGFKKSEKILLFKKIRKSLIEYLLP